MARKVYTTIEYTHFGDILRMVKEMLDIQNNNLSDMLYAEGEQVGYQGWFTKSEKPEKKVTESRLSQWMHGSRNVPTRYYPVILSLALKTVNKIEDPAKRAPYIKNIRKSVVHQMLDNLGVSDEHLDAINLKKGTVL